MKKSLLFLTLIFFLGFSVKATDYYIASNGNDGNNGTSQSSPWRSLDKLNAYFSNLKAGDRILFRRGDTFYGRIEASIAGRSGNPVTYGAYGSGNKPIITGFTEVNSWNNLGGNIWESTTAVSTLSKLNMVVVNGVNTPMGRYPNGDATYPYFPNYFQFQSHTGTGKKGSGTATITSSSLNGSTNWKGAEVVVRVTQWILAKAVISAHNGSSLSYIGESGEVLEDNYGFFIQNDPRTLDMQNEWYFNPSTKKIRIYSSGTPSNVRVASIDTLFNSHNMPSPVSYTVLENINFVGANYTAVSFNGNGNRSVPTITNCDVSFSGNYGISTSGLSNAIIDNNYIYGSASCAIWTTNGSRMTVTNNTIRATGVVSPYKENGYDGSSIMVNTMDNSLVQYNNIDSSEYCGIQFAGNNFQVRNNFINNSSLIKGDGAGIYTVGSGQSGRIVDGNIVLNSKGNYKGTRDAVGSGYAFGIYLDELSSNLVLTNNTVANCAAAGIFLHATNNITARGNTMYNNGNPPIWGNAGFFVQGNGGGQTGIVRNNILTNNIIFARNSNHYALGYAFANGSNNGPSTFGIIDSNYYAKPIDPGTTFNSNKDMSFSQWQSFSNQDAHSQEVSKKINNVNELRFEYNPGSGKKTIPLDANYIDAKGKSFNGSIVLDPYSSAVLIRNGDLQGQPPIANAGDDQTITLPTNSVVLNGSGSLSRGTTINSYSWAKVSGPSSGKIVNPNNASTSVTELVEGVYVFELTVTDNNGVSNSAIVKISVNSSGNLLEAVNPTNPVKGLNYNYYEGINYLMMPDFSKITPVKTGATSNCDISVADRANQFAINFTGYINVPSDGQYTFYTNSDDGSMLFIDNEPIVNNDGLHGWVEGSGKIGLKAGMHAISVSFFQGTGGKGLQVSYEGPGISKQIIPASVLYRSITESLLPASNPANIVNGIDYQYYEGSNYSMTPDFSKITPVKTNATNNFDISVASRADQYAINFTGFIDVPSDGQYTFYTNSDDGSMLFIDNVPVVNNDGLHDWVEKSGKIGLKAGKHSISVRFFQAAGGKGLQVSYEGPGLSKRIIPSSELYRVVSDLGLLPASNPTNIVNGQDYNYYESSSYSNLPDFSKITPVKTSTTNNFDISVANRADQYAINFTGYIDVPSDGQYVFYTNSDDGSMLFIDNVAIVNNDGLHDWVEKSGKIGLKAGKHSISVRFFQATGGKGIQVSYEGPGISKKIIPASVLYRVDKGTDLISPVYPNNPVNGLDYKYLEANNYSRMPIFSNPLKTGTSSNFDLSVANRAEDFAINFTGYIEVLSDGQYTFYTGSDDGSMLYIANKLVVDNNGLHGWEEKSGKIGLKAGKHDISVEFFQASGDKSLVVYYEGPGISKRIVPISILYRSQGAFARGTSGLRGEALASTNPLKDQTLTESSEIGIKAYPNPFVNSIIITLNGEAGEFKLQMMDALGRTMWTKSASKNEGFYQLSVSTSNLQKGIYFLKVIQNDKSSIIKLLK